MATDDTQKPHSTGPRLVGMTGAYRGNEYFIEGDEYTIGRAGDSDMVLDENTISGKHAVIRKVGDTYEIRDMKSTNGTYVNGVKIDAKPLRTDDKIKFDVFEFKYVNPAEVARTVVQQAPDFEAKQTVVRGQEAIKEPQPQPQAPPAPAPQPAAHVEQGRPQPRIQQASYERGGSMFGGLILGLIVAFLFSYGGYFLALLVSAATTGAFADFMANIVSAIKMPLAALPFMHTHVPWMNVGSWDVGAIITLVALPLALLLGGLLTQTIARKNRFATALIFSIFYVVIALVAQFAVYEFNFEMLKMANMVGGGSALGINDPLINLLVVYGYFFGVTFVISFIGTLMGRRH